MKKWLLTSAMALQCLNLNAAPQNSDNFYVEASWLYWQVDSSNYDFLNARTTVLTNSGVNALNTREEKDITQKMPWDSGFRVGLGYNLPCLGIDVKATWTDFHSSATKKASFVQPNVTNTTDEYVWPLSQDNVSLTDSTETLTGDPVDLFARQKISFAFDPVNVEFGKWLTFDCVNLQFRPHVGVQYLQYHDNRRFSRYSNVFEVDGLATGEYQSKQKFQGFGVRAGFDVLMPLFCNISLIGNVAASIDWGRNKFFYSVDTIDFDGEGDSRENSLQLKKNSKASQALIDLGVGIRWDTCLCDCYDFSLEALWEQHQLINGSKPWTVQSNTLGAGFQRNTDLTVRGLTLTAGLTF